MGRSAVFLDRDGTINVDKDYLYEIDKFEYLCGVQDALRFFQQRGYILIIITNQSGIARGYYTEEDYLQLNQWMVKDLQKKGICIAKSYCCPHLPDAPIIKYRKVCNCRKPRIGFYLTAQQEFNIDMEKSIAIGDKLRDVAICNEFRMRGYLLKNGKKQQIPNNVIQCKNWEEIINCERNKNGYCENNKI